MFVLQTEPNCIGAFEGWNVVIVTEKKREDGFRRLLEAGGATVLASKYVKLYLLPWR